MMDKIIITVNFLFDFFSFVKLIFTFFSFNLFDGNSSECNEDPHLGQKFSSLISLPQLPQKEFFSDSLISDFITLDSLSFTFSCEFSDSFLFSGSNLGSKFDVSFNLLEYSGNHKSCILQIVPLYDLPNMLWLVL